MGILVLLSLSSYMDRSIIALLVAPMKADLSLTDTQFGAAQGLAFATTFTLCAIPLGMAIDRFSRRLLILAGVLTWSIGCIGCGLAWNFPSLLLARMTVGVGEAVLVPAGMSLIGDLFPPNKRGVAVGVFGAAPYISFFISYAGGGALITSLNVQGGLHLPGMATVETWRAVFFIIGAPGVLLALLALMIRDARQPGDPNDTTKAESWIGIFKLRWRVLVPFFIGIGPLVGVGAVVTQWSPAFLIRKFDLPVSEIGLWIGVSYGLVAPFGSVLTGIMLDRVYASGGRTGPFWLAIVTAMLCGPMFIATFLQWDATASLICLSIGLIFMSGIATVVGGCIQLIVPPEARGRITAMTMLTTVGFGQGIAVLLVPLFSDYVLKSEAEIGTAIAVVVGSLCLLTAVSFAAGLSPLKRLLHQSAVRKVNQAGLT